MSFAGELLKNAEELIKNGLHTSEIVTGYQMALNKTIELLPSLVVRTVNDVRDAEELKIAIRSVIGTKQAGYEDFLADLVVNACRTTFATGVAHPRLNVDNVRIAKLRGGDVLQSKIIKGMVLLRDTEGAGVGWGGVMHVYMTAYG